MRILVLGITGMLGHAVWLNLKNIHETFGTIRKDGVGSNSMCPLFDNTNNHILDSIDVLSESAIERALEISKPEVVINCIGIIKQCRSAKDPFLSIYLNGLFPHILAKRCDKHGLRLIHISTDCVFSGKRGGYVESDISDAQDLYGRTKLLGEVTGNGCLTIRTSIIGRELSGSKGLFEWFLSQKKQVYGYRNAIFSGLTTYTLAEVIKTLIEGHPTVEGLYHISSEAINKYDLLNRLKNALDLNIEIIPNDSVVVDRSLDSTKFRKLTHIYIPTWDEMLGDLVKRVPNYEKWRF